MAQDELHQKLSTQKLRRLRRIKWRLPGGHRARVAPKYLARLYSGESTAVQKIKQYISSKVMKGSAAAERLLELAYILDRMVKEENDDMVNMQSVDVICRTMYGLQKAWGRVTCRDDWERPKSLGAGAKRESKVEWELLKE